MLRTDADACNFVVTFQAVAALARTSNWGTIVSHVLCFHWCAILRFIHTFFAVMLVIVPAYLFRFVVASCFCFSYDAITQEQKCGSRKNHKNQRKCSHCKVKMPGWFFLFLNFFKNNNTPWVPESLCFKLQIPAFIFFHSGNARCFFIWTFLRKCGLQ